MSKKFILFLLQHLKMKAESFRTITLTSNDLNSAQPGLRLRLQEKSRELGKIKSRRKHQTCSVEKIVTWMQNLVTKAEDAIGLEYGSDATKTEKNKEKLKQYFKKMRDHMDAQENELLVEMDTMSPEEQEQTLLFWKVATKFVTDVIDWVKKTFDYVFEKIKAGYKLVKEAVQGFFKSVLDLFKSVF